MQRCEHEVAGLGGGEREADGLRIAHLSDEDDVGILPERIAQAGREVGDVASDLAAAQDRSVGGVEDVLDGIFERGQDDRATPKGLLRERGERGRLARAGGAAHEHEAVRQLDEIVERDGQVERREGGRAAR